MKKIIIYVILLIFTVPSVFGADTSYIETNQNKTSNYIANAINSDGKIIKWNKKIINVYVEPCPSDKQKIVYSAIYTYNNTFASLLKLKIVKKVEEADITIKFEKHLDKNGEAEALGYTTYEYYVYEKMSYMKTAKVQLLDSPKLPNSKLKGVVLHELGHAIGIAGHSLNPNDIMHPTCQGKNVFSKRDIATIRMIYKAEISTNTFKNAVKDYEKKQSEMDLEVLLRDTQYSPNKYIVWVNLGDYYYKKRNYTKALEIYKIAITKDNAPSIINKRISYCYTGLGNKKMAEKYIKLAK